MRGAKAKSAATTTTTMMTTTATVTATTTTAITAGMGTARETGTARDVVAATEQPRSRKLEGHRQVEKPWGRELWWAANDLYAGKLLYIDKGHRLSLQFHRHKDETSYLLDGRLLVAQGPSEDELREWLAEPGDSWRNEPEVVHTITALEDSVVIEASTPQLDDVVRLRDDYGRD